MRIQSLREFVVLTQKLNFSKAATFLGITQSTLSKHIATLEKELGFQLFERTTAQVELTQGGTIFLEEAHEVIEAYDRALALTHKRLKEISRKVLINGTLHHPAITRVFGHVMHSYQTDGKPFNIDQSRAQYSSVQDLMDNDTSDVLILLNSNIIDRERFEVVPLFRDRICALFPTDHPLVGSGSLKLQDLEEEKILMIMGDSNFEDWYYLKEVFEKKNIIPRTKLLKFNTTYGIFNSMSYESRYLMPASTIPSWVGIIEEHLLGMPIDDQDCYYEYCLVYRKDNENPYLSEFIQRVIAEMPKCDFVEAC